MRLDRSNSPVNESSYSVDIGNLAWAVTDKELLELFQAFHPLACNVLTNMYGRSRGFAIMKFRSDVDAENAIRAMNHVEIAGRKLECRVDRGPVKPEESDGKNSIFVSKLGSSIVDNAELAGLFSHIAPVVSATIQKSLQGRPKGWG
jgi:RNA recognition motif-containing protein